MGLSPRWGRGLMTACLRHYLVTPGAAEGDESCQEEGGDRACDPGGENAHCENAVRCRVVSHQPELDNLILNSGLPGGLGLCVRTQRMYVRERDKKSCSG